MRIKLTAALPRNFITLAPYMIGEWDVGVSSGSRLRAKVLLFENKRDLRKFWRDKLGKGDLGSRCPAAVNDLQCHCISNTGKEHLECDPRYFCVMGFVKSYLGMEIITHEAVHAGFAYAKRVKHKQWPNSAECDEESVCYPAGRIASAINRIFHKEGIYQ